MTVTVFPITAAASAEKTHPALCACGRCTDRLLALLARPLVEPGPLTDPALAGPGASEGADRGR